MVVIGAWIRWCFLVVVAAVLGSARLSAHTVPSMTVEAEFGTDHSYVLRINLDPRLFLSTNPTTLPPVEASWWREQSDEQKKASLQQALDYVQKALTVIFGGKAIALPAFSFQPMDGAANTPFTTETKEVHLLAETSGKAEASEFEVALGKDANTSLILLNSYGGNVERRPQVLFPGETSRAFLLQAK